MNTGLDKKSRPAAKANDKMKISFKPTETQIAEIGKWLIEEQNMTGEGFYCNWDSIIYSFNKNKAVVISIDKKTIGFATWKYSYDFTATIDIVEIKPTHRKKGFGKVLILQLFKYFKDKNIFVVDLQCAPASSEKTWKHLGFNSFPDNGEDGNKQLYQILIPSSKTITFNDENEFIELWNNEPCYEPTWTWKLEFKEGTRNLIKPIVHPCHNDWRIRWKQKGVTVEDDNVKYFGKNEIYFGKFLIITKMPELK